MTGFSFPNLPPLLLLKYISVASIAVSDLIPLSVTETASRHSSSNSTLCHRKQRGLYQGMANMWENKYTIACALAKHCPGQIVRTRSRPRRSVRWLGEWYVWMVCFNSAKLNETAFTYRQANGLLYAGPVSVHCRKGYHADIPTCRGHFSCSVSLWLQRKWIFSYHSTCRIKASPINCAVSIFWALWPWLERWGAYFWVSV